MQQNFYHAGSNKAIRAYPYAIHVKDRDGKWVDKESERPVSNHFLHQEAETYTYDERRNRLTKRIQAAGSDTINYYTMNIGD